MTSSLRVQSTTTVFSNISETLQSTSAKSKSALLYALPNIFQQCIQQDLQNPQPLKKTKKKSDIPEKHGVIYRCMWVFYRVILWVVRPCIAFIANQYLESVIRPIRAGEIAREHELNARKIFKDDSLTLTAVTISDALITEVLRMMKEGPSIEAQYRPGMIKDMFYEDGTLTVTGAIIQKFLSTKENQRFVSCLIETNLLTIFSRISQTVCDLETTNPYALKDIVHTILDNFNKCLSTEPPSFNEELCAEVFSQAVIDLLFSKATAKNRSRKKGKIDINLDSIDCARWIKTKIRTKLLHTIEKSIRTDLSKELLKMNEEETMSRDLLFDIAKAVRNNLLKDAEDKEKESLKKGMPSLIPMECVTLEKRKKIDCAYKREEDFQQTVKESLLKFLLTVSPENFGNINKKYITEKRLNKVIKKISNEINKYSLKNLVHFAFKMASQQVMKESDKDKMYLRVGLVFSKKIIHNKLEADTEKAAKVEKNKKAQEDHQKIEEELIGSWEKIYKVLFPKSRLFQKGASLFSAAEKIKAIVNDVYAGLWREDFKNLPVVLVQQTVRALDVAVKT